MARSWWSGCVTRSYMMTRYTILILVDMSNALYRIELKNTAYAYKCRPGGNFTPYGNIHIYIYICVYCQINDLIWFDLSDERLRLPTTCYNPRPAVVVGSNFYHSRTSSHTLRFLYDISSMIVAYWSPNRMQVADCCTTIVRPSYDSLWLSAISNDWSYDRLRPSYDNRATT